MLSDSPPERDVIWTEEGVQGAGRFVQRAWRLANDIAAAAGHANGSQAAGPAGTAVRKAAHKALAAVEEDIERLRFNRCVAHIYELANSLQEMLASAAGREEPGVASAWREAGRIFVQLLAPMMPHLAEECWQALGGEGLVAAASWPVVDRSLLVEDEITLRVQVNGKKRADVTVRRDADQAAIEAAVLSLDAVQRAIEGRAPRKIIIVPQRIVNVVA
jgi:leucyl-tRNA synthetase